MTVQRHYSCDACGEAFWVTLESKKAPPPACPYCSGTGEIPETIVPHLRFKRREADDRTRAMVEEARAPGIPSAASTYLKSSDQVFRAMEAGSQFRAEMAASELNVPVSEVSHLKITDMNDRPRQGEISAKVPMSPEGHMMSSRAQQMSFGSAQAQAAGAEYAKAVNVGPERGSHGNAWGQAIRNVHSGLEAGIRHRGQINR